MLSDHIPLGPLELSQRTLTTKGSLKVSDLGSIIHAECVFLEFLGESASQPPPRLLGRLDRLGLVS